jgi:AraC-like DNA-binding protein
MALRRVLYNCCMYLDAAPARNRAEFTTLGHGTTLMTASFADHAFERHSHDCFAVGVTTYGIQRFHCKGRRHDSRPGDLVLFNPDEDHDGNPGTPEGFRYTIWYVPDAFVRDCLDADAGLPGGPYFAAPHVTDARMATAFARLMHGLSDAPHESLRKEARMRALLTALLARHGERPASGLAPRRVNAACLKRVKDYIHAHYQRDVTSAELAAVAGLSRAHLSRAFNAAFHVPPHVYLNAVRVARAQVLMRAGLPLATVAFECGFADQSHLSRRFKGSVGVTPGDWRRMVCASPRTA